MRSEKEIKDRIKIAQHSIEKPALKWTLEGQPRYSVAELYKICEDKRVPIRNKFGNYFTSHDLVELLKDKKKVEKLLK